MKVSTKIATILMVSLPLLAAGKVFKDTSEFRDSKELKGYLNVKLDTYATMVKEPKGTDCDWVMFDPSFDLADLQKSTVEFFPDSITRNGGWDASYWGLYGGWYGNGLTTSFESALRTRGINLKHQAAPAGSAAPMSPMQVAMAQAYAAQGMQMPGQQTQDKAKAAATEPPALTAMQQRIEMDRYDEDKKAVGVEEAAKRAEERDAKRTNDWKAKQGAATAEAAQAARPKSPEEIKGYVCVLYITESKVQTATMWIPLVPTTNTTTGEFILLKDGKAVLAGRHNAVGAYTGSAPKCATALASAFDVKIAKK